MPVRMLHIVGSMSPSGIGNFIMNIYRNIDREKVQFDFIVHETREVSFEDEIKALGGRVFTATRKSVSPVKNFMDIKRIVREGHYDIVFRHTDISTVAFDLLAAKWGGAKIRISHSHNTTTPHARLHKLFMPFLNYVVTDRFACSPKAGEWLYGGKPFTFIVNAIRLDTFSYNKEVREKMRQQEGLDGRLVVGHVGNFMTPKNHTFQLDILAELIKLDPSVCMVFVGDGAWRERIENKISDLHLENNIKLVGVRNDIPALLQAMDVFLFPSLYEGLPIAMVEAQCAGLPVLASDCITADVDVTPLVEKMSLGDSAKAWAEKILEMAKQERKAPDEALFAKKGFDIREMVKQYEELANRASK